jgi:hypothetical protein
MRDTIVNVCYWLKADMHSCTAHVRFGSEADMCSAMRHVRFTPNSDCKSRHAANDPWKICGVALKPALSV